MSDMASYITGIRNRGIAVTELDDTAVTAVVNECLSEYSRFKPLVAIKVFETVADQQAYSWTEIGDADGHVALKVLWKHSTSSTIDLYNILGIPVGYDYHNPADLVIEQIRDAAFAKAFGCGGYQIEDGGSVYLDPTPTESGIDVFVLYTKAHASVATIKDADRDIFLDLVESKLSSRIVNEIAKKSASLRVKTPEYERDAASQIGAWRAIAKEKYKQFVDKAQAGGAAAGRD
jgi:hypothetical protein